MTVSCFPDFLFLSIFFSKSSPVWFAMRGCFFDKNTPPAGGGVFYGSYFA